MIGDEKSNFAFTFIDLDLNVGITFSLIIWLTLKWSVSSPYMRSLHMSSIIDSICIIVSMTALVDKRLIVIDRWCELLEDILMKRSLHLLDQHLFPVYGILAIPRFFLLDGLFLGCQSQLIIAWLIIYIYKMKIEH